MDRGVIMHKKKSTGRGGKRPGAGRPAIFRTGRRKITVLLEAATANKLDAAAAALGEPVTRIAATAIDQWLAKRVRQCVAHRRTLARLETAWQAPQASLHDGGAGNSGWSTG